jgi:hypothetical protein
MTQREADLAAVANYLQQCYDAIALHEANIAAAQATIEAEKKIIADFQISAMTLRETQARIQALPL